jgi:PAS domain S-box-containing protein
MFGWRADEAVGQPLTLLMPERHREAHRAGLARLAAGGEPRVVGRPVELVGLRRGGEEFAVELRIDAWSSGGAAFFTGIVRDITDRRRRIEQIERLNQELEAFSYSVSHDLRAPLRAIDGFARILLEDHAPRLDDEGRRVAGVISDSARRMGQLIDDLLEFSRTGRAALHVDDVDMRELATSVAQQLAGAADGRRIELSVGELPPARGDRRLLRQVFVNLIGNAVKYTRGRDPARVEVGGELGSDGAAWWVRDNGVGFDMQYASKLFGVFQRLHSQEEFEGTGVGLALVQRIVARHGGRVFAEGKVGGGARFGFTLDAPGGSDGAS